MIEVRRASKDDLPACLAMTARFHGASPVAEGIIPRRRANANNSCSGKVAGGAAGVAEFRKIRRTLRSRSGKNVRLVRFPRVVDCFGPQRLGRMAGVLAGAVYVSRKIRRKFSPRAVEGVSWTGELVHISLSGQYRGAAGPDGSGVSLAGSGSGDGVAKRSRHGFAGTAFRGGLVG